MHPNFSSKVVLNNYLHIDKHVTLLNLAFLLYVIYRTMHYLIINSYTVSEFYFTVEKCHYKRFIVVKGSTVLMELRVIVTALILNAYV